ncbi:MAG TPA: zf-HC2 domain-containing protein [Intrasporangium sp.]|uniref:zf-HC2 domain-containing protein n=1 Tax=Intrasporangium sp. TaxID=1925024 RepID=UPI002D790AFD|nr:zf-HC2 domain-containing protein [Intrasporangium sp.]HET7398204.1 zf-HC2 domain-containing protein [Intrasporangium sp.]
MTSGPTSGPDDLHMLLGCFVLGGLSASDHQAFTEHLRGCSQCQQEMGQVSGLPHLLDLAAPTDLPEPGPSGVPDLLVKLSRRRRRTRRLLAAAASVAAVLLVGVGVLLGPRLSTSPAPRELPTARYAAVPAPGSSVKVEVAVVTRGWGSQLDVSCEQLPTGGELSLWVRDRSGRATQVASWNATATGYATVTGATAVRPPDIRVLEVRTGTGQVLASAST